MELMVYPLGFPVHISSPSALVLRAAQEAWGHCSRLFDTDPVTVTLEVRDDGCEWVEPAYAVDNRGFVLAGGNDGLDGDVVSGVIKGSVCGSVAARTGDFRYFYLEAAVLTMLSHRFLAPAHGALVSRHRQGYLLCGDSMAGKSTMAYGCARAGWTYTTDDGTFLLRQDAGLRGVGNCDLVRLRPESIGLFPDLANRPLVIRPNGKAAIELNTRLIPSLTTEPVATVDVAVLLRRERGAIGRLTRIEPTRLLAYFERIARPIAPPAIYAEQRAVYERFLRVPCWELSYDRLDDGIRCLEGLG